MTNSEHPSPDARGSALPASISEISRAVDALREALRALSEGPPADRMCAAAGARGAGGAGMTVADVDAALADLPDDLEPAEMFGQAMERLAALLDADRSMLLFAEAPGPLVPVAARGFRREDPGAIAIAPGEGLLGRALVEGRTLVRSDPTASFPGDPFLGRFPVRSAVVVPVRSGAVTVGVLYAGARRRDDPFSAEQMLVLLAVADRIGAAHTHRRVAARAALHLERLRLLRSFTAETAVGRGLFLTLARACEVGTRLLGVSAAAVGLLEGGPALVLKAASGLPEALAPGMTIAGDGEDVIRRALDAATGVPCGDPRDGAGADADFLVAAGLRACMTVVLRPRDTPAGVLYLADARPRQFASEEIEVARLLGSLIGLAVENDRLYAEARVAYDALASAQERLVQTEKVRALGSMAGGLAHEFNNILAIILGKTQLLLARPQDDKTRESLGHVEEAAWRAADVVRRLQGFAAPAVGELTGLVDMKAVAEDAITLTRGVWKDEAEARGVRIDVVADLEDTPLVPGNSAEIREALTNLVLNAVDAMPAGGRLRVVARREGDGAVVVVEDTGEGMPEHVRRLAFEPFFSTRSPLRTGLGLSVVHGVVARHRGRIDIASEPGAGTRVTVWLPTSEARESAVGSGRTSVPVTSPGAILILEEEPTLRAILVDAVAAAGHRAEAAADGASGLARLHHERFDALLADVSLPGPSGLEVARAAKNIRPDMPVVLITSWGDLLDPLTLRDSGVDLTLVKPFRLDRVRAVLADALRLRRRP